MVPIEDDLVVTDESIPGWALVTTEEGDGYVSTDYVTLTTEYVQAESKAEEEARLAKEEAEREAAAAAAASARKKNSESSSSSSSSSDSSASYSAPTSSNGQAVASYACQFVGNPYVYGGSSLYEWNGLFRICYECVFSIWNWSSAFIQCVEAVVMK